LYAYIVHKAAEIGVFVYQINGWTDHVHVIGAIPPHVSAAHAVKTMKGASSHDLNQQGLDYRFAWQRGYGMLTLGQRQRSDAEKYVQAQKDHHRKQTANPWLERYADIDEGPEDITFEKGQPLPLLREQIPTYGVLGEPAF
jgi:putative transposase